MSDPSSLLNQFLEQITGPTPDASQFASSESAAHQHAQTRVVVDAQPT